MKKLFNAIRKGDIETVRGLLEKEPGLVNCVAVQPPKKDDGQSPLQVALKTGQMDIAELLLDHGADVTFMEAEECANEWRAPVIHDAINMAVMNCRWNTARPGLFGPKVTTIHTKAEAERAAGILERMLKAGADVNQEDTYGNSGVERFCLQANQILPQYNHVTGELSQDKVVTRELRDDLMRVMKLLKQYGLDKDHVAPSYGKPMVEFTSKDSPVYEYLSIL